VTETLSRCAQLAQDEELFWHGLVQHHWREACRSEDDGIIALSVAGLAALHPALQRRLLRFGLERLRGHLQAVNAVHIEALMRLLEPDKDRRELHLPGGLRAARTGDALILRRTAAPPAEPFERVLADAGWYEFPELRLELSFHELKEPGLADLAGLRADPNRAWMDANSLSWPLVVRSWRAGDWFQPLGLQGRKKLQDFFTDVKVPRDERAHIPLLCDQQKICWVVGYRLDDRVKVRAVTRQVLKVEWNRR
jgi:tRNA(Ile)-lysidine synthase